MLGLAGSIICCDLALPTLAFPGVCTPMTPYQKRLTPITDRMAGDMRIRNLAQATIDAYTYHVGRFADFIRGPIGDATAEDVRNFQLYLIEEKKVGWSSSLPETHTLLSRHAGQPQPRWSGYSGCDCCFGSAMPLDPSRCPCWHSPRSSTLDRPEDLLRSESRCGWKGQVLLGS